MSILVAMAGSPNMVGSQFNLSAVGPSDAVYKSPERRAFLIIDSLHDSPRKTAISAASKVLDRVLRMASSLGLPRELSPGKKTGGATCGRRPGQDRLTIDSAADSYRFSKRPTQTHTDIDTV